jgi:hypothetical protein
MLLHTWYKTAETFEFDNERQKFVERFSCYSRFRKEVFKQISPTHLVGSTEYSIPVFVPTESSAKYDPKFYSLCSLIPYSYYFYNFYALWRRETPIDSSFFGTLYNHVFNLAVTDHVIAMLGIDFVAQLLYHQIANMHGQPQEMIREEILSIIDKYGMEHFSQSEALIASYDLMLFDMFNCLALSSSVCDPVALFFFDAMKYWRFSTATSFDKVRFKRVRNVDEVDKELLPILRGELPVQFQRTSRKRVIRTMANDYFDRDYNINVRKITRELASEIETHYNPNVVEDAEVVVEKKDRGIMFEEQDICFPRDCDGSTNKYSILSQSINEVKKEMEMIDTIQTPCFQVLKLAAFGSETIYVEGQAVSKNILNKVSEEMLGVTVTEILGEKNAYSSRRRSIGSKERLQIGEFFHVLDEYSSMYTFYLGGTVYCIYNQREFLYHWILVKYLLLLHYRRYYLSNDKLRAYEFPFYVDEQGHCFFGFYNFKMACKNARSRSRFSSMNTRRNNDQHPGVLIPVQGFYSQSGFLAGLM